MKTLLPIALVSIAMAGAANAASFSFDLIWDGSTLTETSPGSGLSPTILNNGDDFTLTIRAQGNDFWTALNGADTEFFPLNPRASGGTTGDVTARLSNDGATVYTDSTVENRCCAELGFTRWEGLAAGTIFDQIVMEYTLVSGGSQTIFADGTSVQSFWEDANVLSGSRYSYTDVPEVPLPAGAALLLTGLAGLAIGRRRS